MSLASALLSRDVPVTVLEAGHYPRHRVCGEFISGASGATLEELGIDGLFDDARRHHTVSWFESGRLIHSDRLEDAALGISRYLLDERLLRHVETLGGTIRCGVRGQPISGEGRVWTAGRKTGNSPWLGLKAHVRGIKTSADLEMHSGTNGYAGLAEVEDGWINVCGLFRLDRSLKARPGDLLTTYLEAGGNRALAAQLRDCEWREGSACAVAGFKTGRQKPLPGTLALGDAASMIAPFTGNGMAMAFQSAEMAAEPLAAWSHGESSWQDAVNRIRSRVDRTFTRRLAMAAALHPLVLDQGGRNLVCGLSSARLLSFRTMVSIVR